MLYSELCEIYEKLEKTPSRLEKTEILSSFLKKIKKEENKEILYLLKGRIFPDYDSREIGISEQLTIKALGRATGTEKDKIVKEWKKSGDLGEVAFILIKKKKQSTLFSKKLTTEKVLENLRKLPELEGKGTVDKKIGLISELITSSSGTEAKYIVRTLLADLRIGLGDSTIRDAIVWVCFDKDDKESYVLVQESYDRTTDFALVLEEACKGKKALEEAEITPGKPLKVMLYPKVTSIKEAFEVVGKPAACEFKYDGFRMLINKDEKGKIRIFTRRLDEVTKQFPEVEGYAKKHVNAKTFILDSEAVGFDPKTGRSKQFQEISQRIKRKYDIEKVQKELPIEINVFDILFYNGKSLLKTPFIERRKILEKIIQEKKHMIVLADQIITDNEKKVSEFYEKALAEGEEGIMIKNLQSGYKPGARVGYGVKLKPTENELDLVIIKAEYGTGKRGGWLTSYTVACRNEDNELLEIGKVSTGLKEKPEEGTSFEEMTHKLKKLIKSENGREVTVKPEIVITVNYQEIQASPTYSSGYALRFPRFTRLREDRSIKDIASLDEVKKDYKRQRSYKLG